MKNMRKMIPAIAMLLVSAVMLTTASFAWFTMNTEVTAEGMQLQAKADSSLVISDAPLKYNTGADTVDFTSSVNKLYPMTWGKYTDDEGEEVDGWVTPTNMGGINTLTGAIVDGDTWKYAAPTAGNQYIEKEVYIASAGAVMKEAAITIKLAAPVTSLGSAAKAYAAAIYYVPATTTNDNGETVANPAWADNASISIDDEPLKTVYVDTASNRNVVTLDKKMDIPSILGVGEQDEATTGLKFIIRFFVDGNLTSVDNDVIEVTTGYEYKKASGNYNAATQYYVKGANTYEYTAVDGAKAEDYNTYYVLSNGAYTLASSVEGAAFDANTTYYTQKTIENYVQAIIPEGMTAESSVLGTWYTRNAIKKNVNYNYIRTDDVPGTGTELEITFTTAGK